MGLIAPASAFAPITNTLDPFPDHVSMYGLPYADLAPTATGPIRFPWCVWSPGLLVEEATTNMITNPAPVSTTGYTATNGTLALDSTFGMTVQTSLSLTATTITSSVNVLPCITTVAATTYTFSVYVYTAVRPVTVQLYVSWYTSADGYISTTVGDTPTLSPGTWQRLTYTTTSPALGVKAYPTVSMLAPSVIGDKIWVANWQFEQKGHATSYTDGSLGTGYSWSGTANASTSLRAASNLSYALPISAASTNGLTICAWIGDWTGPAISRSAEFVRVTDVSGNIALLIDYTNSTGNFRARTATGTAALTTDATLPPPTFLAATCEGALLTGYLFQPSPDSDVDVPPVTTTAAITTISAAMTTVLMGPSGAQSNAAVGQVLVFNSALDTGTLEILARSTAPTAFNSDPRIVFSAGSGTDVVGTTASALATSGTFQLLGVTPGRLELTANLTTILTTAQEAYTYRLALPFGTGYGIGSQVEINGDGNLYTVAAKASGLEDYMFF
jgi:hypothetical protein